MRHAKILDCTLRDGAYLVDKDFGNMTIQGIISGLIKAKVDFIEIGFFQDDGFGEGKTVFLNSKDARRFIPSDKSGCQFTVLADFSRYSINNLDERTEGGIDGVRECFFKHERFEAIKYCKVIKEKGYEVFIQPVDILGYTDNELIEFIELINELEPYCFSIVDTFGSMYQEDLHRIFELINHNLIQSCKIGFHSHNNMQLSNALSQECIRMTSGKREVIIDGTLSGMGRGAGNTPTELIAQYMVSRLGYSYDIDAILDVIDSCMDNVRSRCTWGYSTPYFIAGSYGAHVNNITYLANKNSIRSKDIRYILNKIGVAERKRYDYDLLENTYLDLLRFDIDDTESLHKLKNIIGAKSVLIVAPGNTAVTCIDNIQKYIQEEKPVVITVNFIHEGIKTDYVYMNNVKRFDYWKNNKNFMSMNKILTSNVNKEINDANNILTISFMKLVKCGWEHFDNSTIMLLRLLDICSVKKIAIAGFDGYEYADSEKHNYVNKFLESSMQVFNFSEVNSEISKMLVDYINTRTNKDVAITFITPSRFERCLKAEKMSE